jgi:hypothetical protein
MQLTGQLYGYPTWLPCGTGRAGLTQDLYEIEPFQELERGGMKHGIFALVHLPQFCPSQHLQSSHLASFAFFRPRPSFSLLPLLHFGTSRSSILELPKPSILEDLVYCLASSWLILSISDPSHLYLVFTNIRSSFSCAFHTNAQYRTPSICLSFLFIHKFQRDPVQ